MHAVVQQFVGDGPQIELELAEPQRQVTAAKALVEHHLFGIDRPAFDINAGAQHLADQRRVAVGVFHLHVVPGIGFVDGENPEHVPVVFLQETIDSVGIPRGRWWADRIVAGGGGVKRRRRGHVGNALAPLELRHFDDLTAVGIRQFENVRLLDETLDVSHGGACIGD